MSAVSDFGVQSWCFRAVKENERVARMIRELGMATVELSGAHGDFSAPESFRQVVDTYRAGGVAIVSFGVLTFTGDERERAWFESAALAGARHIACHFQIDSYVRALPKVRAWSREFGVRVGIHCHGGHQFGGSPDVLDHLLALGSPEVGLCLDTAWAMQIGPYKGNPVEWVQRYAGRIYGVHFKDFVFARNAQWEDVVLGTGTLDLPGFVDALHESGFDGAAVIEYEAEPENPMPALQACAAALRGVLPL